MTPRASIALLAVLGVIDLALFGAIRLIPDLVQAAALFAGIWIAVAVVQVAAIGVVWRGAVPLQPGLIVVFGAAVLFRAVMLTAVPQSSDDMYRYVWDGRVQAAGISPYRYPPAAAELAGLRDPEIWEGINRKPSPTIYPPGAQAAFAIIYRIVPDSLTFTKLAFAAVDLLAGGLLALTLRAAGRSPHYALVALWHPLPVFEFAHAGHLDPLLILPVVAAAYFRLKERPAWVGVMLGIAVLVKFFPAVLIGVWWRPREWRLLAAFGATIVAAYLPHLAVGTAVLGFLPSYFGEEEYVSGGRYFFYSLLGGGLPPAVWSVIVVLTLAGISLAFLHRPLSLGSAEWLVRGTVMAYAAMLLVTPSFPWYYGWLLPFAAFRPRAGLLWLPTAVVLAYAWWWLPALAGVPGPGVWIYLPTVALLAYAGWRGRTMPRLQVARSES